jgi:hypothetical protein
MLPDTHNDVAGFEIAVDEVLGVDVTEVTDLAVVHISPLGYEARNPIDSPTGLPAVE